MNLSTHDHSTTTTESTTTAADLPVVATASTATSTAGAPTPFAPPVAARPTPTPALESATPTVDGWIRSAGLTETGRAADEDRSRFLDEIAGLAVSSEPAAKLLRTVRFKLEQDERSGGVVRLDGNDAANAAAVTVAQRLLNVGYLGSVNEREGRLHFALNPIGDGQRSQLISFLKGSWLEHGVRQVARATLGDDAELVMNLSATGPTGLEYELDLAIGLPDGGLAVCDCKAGNRVARFLPRFRDVCDAAGVDGPRAVLVASGVEPEVVADAQAFHRITIVAPGQFAAHLGSLAVARPDDRRVLAVVPDLARADHDGDHDADTATPEGFGPDPGIPPVSLAAHRLTS